ncbi:MAG: hypothetical protein KAW84_06145 [Thermoplasmata archaeon]|nr:hypothetical protein [Thermoplasmata archaeon]
MNLLRAAAVLSLVCMLLIVFPAHESVLADLPGTRSDGDRTVTLELFTAIFCGGCPYADAAADRLLRVIGPERLSVIQYHVSLTDPLRINESDARWHTYGNPGLPSLFLDGEFKSDNATSYEEAFDRYLGFVQESLQVETPVSLELEYHLGGGSVTLNASLDSSESLAGQNLFLRVVLFENILEDNDDIYNYSVRAYNETSVDLVTSPTIQSVTFVLDGSWITENMGAVAFLQVDADGGIYQSANVMFGEPPVITITNPSGGTVSGDLTVEGSCTSGRTLSEAFLKIDDGLWVEVEGTSAWQHDVNTTELSDGPHTIYARVYDIAGTYSEADILSITVEPKGDDYTFTIMLIVSVILIVVLLLILLGKRRREEEEEAPEPEEPEDVESHSR